MKVFWFGMHWIYRWYQTYSLAVEEEEGEGGGSEGGGSEGRGGGEDVEGSHKGVIKKVTSMGNESFTPVGLSERWREM